MHVLPTPVILDDYQQYAMPLIDVIGMGSGGRQAFGLPTSARCVCPAGSRAHAPVISRE